MPLPYLLAATGLVQGDNVHEIASLEVSRGVIEGQVTILAYANAGYVDGSVGQKGAVSTTLILRIRCITV
jgi:hypothetical protein